MNFNNACGLARIAVASAGRQLRSRSSLVARNQPHQQIQRKSFSSGAVEPKEAPKVEPISAANLSSRTHAPNNLEKRMLVFTKKYKTVEEIPSYINQDVMERCRNQVRIKIANYMMIATAIGCIVMIFLGKQAQERGETVQKMNLDWHKEYNEKAAQEDAAAKK
ncbi:UPF0389 protein CG9231 [Toxorhynchites rutilus septentrionalis]|uniref:UPF0389 protein CG9231 n=1 Tax=Toxorhynchites rutilus septentrionalis TaxID=329112 RepID=UPI002478C6AC|nr:UPF0389 protein CG9231 [Toxorhynchites rutilus septentrionalis]XP_055628679.1 UPF0389 protein CG9231 [Toxorhynchites rutilus septentrionalis]